jgi:hypothetical protein
MSAYHIPVAGPGKHAQADFRAAYSDNQDNERLIADGSLPGLAGDPP